MLSFHSVCIENMSISTIDAPNHVLSLILYIGRNREAYASQLHRAGFPRPAVHTTLDSLEDLGILTEELRRSGGRGGIRRVFSLTPLGQRVYKHLAALDSILREVVDK